ncbi:LPXTG cell wall anchor domain-containing protein [Sarcina sp. JB2]|uniref:LPXTG cell wall anchor domain-containing protein n=1 Tax=Candidatus Sarcina troglodytae TaxID=2726954 RepID=A0ACD1BBK4_9CLOT|nr:LPXTG cell wall anchor domain-containing protein [Sarcina sp. JB2]QPJ84758.1 LPXTG cell wall anchor domain-containing protein [Sarcina sp. JB2]
MKGFIKTVLITLSLLLIISIKGEASTLTPPNVQLLGNADGLVHISNTEDMFLYRYNMLPGDSVERTLEIKNQYEDSYELFLRAERVSEKEEYDLLDKLDLKITFDDKVIYVGPTSGEYKITDNISLGTFKPGEEATLFAKVELDGPSTGNEYKNKFAQVNWIFTAVRKDSNDNTSTDKPSNKPSSNKHTTNGGSSTGSGTTTNRGNSISNSTSTNSAVSNAQKSSTSLPYTGQINFLKYIALIGVVLIVIGVIINKKSKSYKE